MVVTGATLRTRRGMEGEQAMSAAAVAPPLYEASDMARALGVSVSALRKWEAAGLVAPLRTVGGSRIYTDGDLATLRARRAERAAARAVGRSARDAAA